MSSVFGLNARPQTANVRPARSFAPLCRVIFCDEHVFLLVVHFLDGFENAQIDGPSSLAVRIKRLHVFRKARAAVAAAGVQEVIADTRIGADAAAHRLDVARRRGPRGSTFRS